MGMIDRFFEAIEKAGITPYEIETKFGVKSAQSKISQMKGGKTNTGKEKSLPSDILSAVCMNCDKINSEYILTGRGNAIIEDEDTDEVSLNTPKTSTITSIPTTNKDIKILDIRVSAGHGVGFDGDENKILGTSIYQTFLDATE